MKIERLKISIVGTGNVGSHLALALHDNEVDITHICSRSIDNALQLCNIIGAEAINDLTLLPKNQLCIVCIPDDVIESVLDKIEVSCPVAYTSGSTSLESLPARNKLGVFYPLQTFTKGYPLNMDEVPFFIESDDDEFGNLLYSLASSISRSVAYANSTERAELHLAAVWVNNFTNHLMLIAKDYLDSKNIDFKHLKPLLFETVHKLNEQSPYDAQTGPARRGDSTIIDQHLSQLNGLPKEIYRLISDNIQNTYSNDEEL